MSKSNPFKPGYGLPPPHLAGRERQQSLLGGRLEDMAAGELVNGVAIYGPRGMGKTALLQWLEEQCAEKKVGCIVETSATMLSSVEALTNALLPVIRSLKGWSVSRVNTGGRWHDIDVDAPAQGAGKEVDLVELLIARCRKKPVVVLLDEAHGPSDSDVLRIFLHTAQRVAQKSPFLLILAGTPGLTETLRKAEATFIERAESMGLGCLDEESAAAALRLPLEKDGIKIAENALNQTVEDSQRYPFFIQQWGEALWNHATSKGISELTPDDVNLVLEDIQAKRTDFYESRYETIRESPQVLAAAVALAQQLMEQDGLDGGVALNIIKSGLDAAAPDADTENTAQEIMRELGRIDFFWRPPGSQRMVPGVPSFITYVHDRIKMS